MLMEHKDSLKESTSDLNKGFLNTSTSNENGNLEGMTHLVEFFKSQMDNLERVLEEKIEKNLDVEDCLKVRLLATMFGKSSEVARWIMDELNLYKILVPDAEPKVQSALDDLVNIKQMASALSLKSLKVLLEPFFDGKFRDFLMLVVTKVN